jgi:hypothetical protein
MFSKNEKNENLLYIPWKITSSVHRLFLEKKRVIFVVIIHKYYWLMCSEWIMNFVVYFYTSEMGHGRCATDGGVQ